MRVLKMDRRPDQGEKSSVVVWFALGGGLLAALILALVVVTYSKVSDLSSRMNSKVDAEDLQRTRYEAIMKELHEIKVDLNYQAANYDFDVKTGLFAMAKKGAAKQ